MLHKVVFKNCENKWDNALPIGNGIFGAMLFYTKHKLHIPMNHYEVYYNIGENVLPKDILAASEKSAPAANVREDMFRIADGNQPKENEPFCFYRLDKQVACGEGIHTRDAQCFSSSYPTTGELVLSFDESLRDGESTHGLYLNDASVQLDLSAQDKQISAKTIMARKDCMITKISQSSAGLLKKVSILMTDYRDIDSPKVEYSKIDDHTFEYTVTRNLSTDGDAPFKFSGVIRLLGASGEIKETENGADIEIFAAESTIHILTGVFTEWQYSNPETDGIREIDSYEKELDELYAEHSKYWTEFFDRSSIDIPDKFLERIYYINQYALDCCSGKDGIMKHQACGLNGLWAIRHPNLWGSMWYWDVNIQAAFAGVFSSNRLELAKVFSDGLRSYVELARKQAADVHNMTGCAGDYPHPFYYCMWPWCAQYLWNLYEYSLDVEYLKNEAYPLFVELCEFYTQAFEYDSERDIYTIYPDISPEQGPLAHNTTITIACVKYLFEFTLKAAKVLGDSSAVLEVIEKMLQKMPEYALSEVGKYGVHFKDSEDAPDNLWIRHPGLLMPLFPIGEFDLSSDDEMKELWKNTISFLEDNCEIGIFGGSWLAAASARLGLGQRAIRLLYEKGIDHMLRSNGLTAEETERFINFCLTIRQPLYYPCMMEFTGEMLAAVNEMLVQSQNDLIRVFPAIPDGDLEMGRMLRDGYALNEYYDRNATYEAWKNVRFDKLLAKGAFEVSASLKEGSLEWILLKSQKGGSAAITSPFMESGLRVFENGNEVPFKYDDGVIAFDTEAQKTYLIAKTADAFCEKDENGQNSAEVLDRETYTKRRVFIGENEDTGYYKAVDGFIRDWYYGNKRMENHTVYKFDMGAVKGKDYRSEITLQTNLSCGLAIGYMGIQFLEDFKYTTKRGYGFKNCDTVKAVDRGTPDLLRRDFVEGEDPCEFVIEAPRGQYELLVVSGDECEDSVTILDAVNGRTTGGEVVKKGRYQCKLLSVMQEEDEPIVLKISTQKGYKWKINCIFVNAVKGY